MAKLVWDKLSERIYETGVKNGVLYVYKNGKYASGVAWNGLVSVTESPSGAEATPLYADDIKYLNLMSVEEFGATIEAYTYPEAFAECNGEKTLGADMAGVYVGQQTRATFGMAYKTAVGNAEDGTDYGYKLHLIYGALAAPSEKAYSSINDSPEAMTFSWEITTTPVEITKVSGLKPTAYVVIDSTKVGEGVMAKIEAKLFGTESDEPTLVTPDEIYDLLKAA